MSLKVFKLTLSFLLSSVVVMAHAGPLFPVHSVNPGEGPYYEGPDQRNYALDRKIPATVSIAEAVSSLAMAQDLAAFSQDDLGQRSDLVIKHLEISLANYNMSLATPEDSKRLRNLTDTLIAFSRFLDQQGTLGQAAQNSELPLKRRFTDLIVAQLRSLKPEIETVNPDVPKKSEFIEARRALFAVLLVETFLDPKSLGSHSQTVFSEIIAKANSHTVLDHQNRMKEALASAKQKLRSLDTAYRDAVLIHVMLAVATIDTFAWSYRLPSFLPSILSTGEFFGVYSSHLSISATTFLMLVTHALYQAGAVAIHRGPLWFKTARIQSQLEKHSTTHRDNRDMDLALIRHDNSYAMPLAAITPTCKALFSRNGKKNSRFRNRPPTLIFF